MANKRKKKVRLVELNFIALTCAQVAPDFIGHLHDMAPFLTDLEKIIHRGKRTILTPRKR